MRKFPTDSELESVGGIYYRKLLGRRSQAVVDVKFEHHPFVAVPVEVLGMLVLGSRYKEKKRLPSVGGRRRSFNVQRVDEALLADDGMYWHRIISESGSDYFVRSIELARVLFFHSPHLIRSALRPNGLSSLAQVDVGDELIEIHFSKLSDFPASQLSSKRVRAHLIWLLLNDDARRSFGSIYRQWLESEDSQPWCFNFSPPPLKGWRLSVVSLTDDKYINEIRSVSVSDFSVSQQIAFHHPNLRNPVRMKSSNRQSESREQSPKVFDVDLPVTPGVSSGTHDVDDGKLNFSLSFTPKIAAVDRPKRPSISARESVDSVEKIEQKIGSGLSDVGSDAQELNYRLNEGGASEVDSDQQEMVAQTPTARFPNFERTIQKLVRDCGYELLAPIACYAFPVPRSGSRQILKTADGKPIQYYLASIRCQDVTICILEADTESLLVAENGQAKTITSLAAVLRGDPKTAILNIAQSVSNSGVKWDVINLRNNCLAYRRCGHPKRFGKAGGRTVRRDDASFVQSWCEILQREIRGLLKDYRTAQEEG